MSTVASYIRHGRGSVRLYLHGPIGLPEFLHAVFGAVELERHEFGPHSFHVEMEVGDSVVVVEAGELPAEVEPWKSSVYVYVEDVDAVFARAVELGAKVLKPVEDKPYQERQGGSLMQQATHGGSPPTRACELRTIRPSLALACAAGPPIDLLASAGCLTQLALPYCQSNSRRRLRA